MHVQSWPRRPRGVPAPRVSSKSCGSWQRFDWEAESCFILCTCPRRTIQATHLLGGSVSCVACCGISSRIGVESGAQDALPAELLRPTTHFLCRGARGARATFATKAQDSEIHGGMVDGYLSSIINSRCCGTCTTTGTLQMSRWLATASQMPSFSSRRASFHDALLLLTTTCALRRRRLLLLTTTCALRWRRLLLLTTTSALQRRRLLLLTTT